jgi:hypothetical protein
MHWSDRLLHMMMTIDRLMSMIDLCHCGDIVRGFVELRSIWKDRFSRTIPRIESICGLANFDFTTMLW